MSKYVGNYAKPYTCSFHNSIFFITVLPSFLSSTCMFKLSSAIDYLDEVSSVPFDTRSTLVSVVSPGANQRLATRLALGPLNTFITRGQSLPNWFSSGQWSMNDFGLAVGGWWVKKPDFQSLFTHENTQAAIFSQHVCSTVRTPVV